MPKSPGVFPKAVWILFAVSLINKMGTMVLPFLSLHLTQQYGLGAKDAGLVIAAYGLAGLIISPVAGICSDRFGALRVLFSSLLCSSFVLFAFLLAKGPLSIALCTFLLALSNESFRPASFAVIGELVPQAKRQAAFALIRLAGNLGMGVGPLVGGLLYAHSFRLLPIVNGSAALAAAGILILSFSLTGGSPSGSLLRAVSRHSDAPASRAVTTPSLFRALFQAFHKFHDRKLWLLIAALVPALVVFFQHESTLPLFVVQERHLSEQVFSRVFLVNALLIVCLELPLNWQFSKYQVSPLRLLPFGAAFVAGGFGLLSLTETQVGVLATTAIWTLGEMILLPASATYVAEISPPSKKGEYMGFYTMSFHIAFVTAPILGGAILDRLGSTSLWILMFGVGLLSVFILLRLGRTQGRAKELHEPV